MDNENVHLFNYSKQTMKFTSKSIELEKWLRKQGNPDPKRQK